MTKVQLGGVSTVRLDKREWKPEEVNGLAFVRCTTCKGRGLQWRAKMGIFPCGCVFRAVFTICAKRYQLIREYQDGEMCTTNWGRIGDVRSKSVGYGYSLKNEEFSADFYLVAKRYLHGRDFQIFKLHYVDGFEWSHVCRALRIDRGFYFHRIYVMQAQLGYLFHELKPYPLYPLADYFSGVVTDWRTAQRERYEAALREELVEFEELPIKDKRRKTDAGVSAGVLGRFPLPIPRTDGGHYVFVPDFEPSCWRPNRWQPNG